MSTTPLSHLRRIEALERQVAELARLLGPRSGGRDERTHPGRIVRWAVTSPAGGAYPYTDANVLPIRFLDVDFAKSAGLGALTKTARSAEPVSFARNVTGQYVLPGIPVLVMSQPALAADRGTWYLLDAPRAFKGKTLGPLSQGLSVEVQIWVKHGTTAGGKARYVSTSAFVHAWDYFLNLGESIAEGTKVRIEYDLAHPDQGGAELGDWMITNAYCRPDNTGSGSAAPPAPSGGGSALGAGGQQLLEQIAGQLADGQAELAEAYASFLIPK